MKKAAIITGYITHIGGVETINKMLSIILKNTGYEVDIISAEEYLKTNKLKIKDLFLFKLIGMPYITSKVFKESKNNYNLLICNGEFSYGISDKKVINLFHGTSFGYLKYLRKNITLKNKLSMIRTIFIQIIGSKKKYVVCVSEFTKKILEEQGIKVNEVISNSVDTNIFKPVLTEKINNFISIGSSAYNGYAKGFDIIEKLEKENNLKIKCISNNEPYKNADWELFKKYKTLPKLYNSSEILLFPSRFEACQMVPLEAMACGIPVVMSKVGIGEEISKKIPEFVCESENEKEYLEKIKIIKKNYTYFSKESRNLVLTHYSYEIFKKKWLKLIKEFEKR